MTRLRILAACAAALLSLTGCTDPTDDTYLPALKQDPMAAWAPAGAGTPTRTFEVGYRAGGTFEGKRRQAQILRIYTLPDDAAVTAAVAAGITAAQAAGWTTTVTEGILTKPMAGTNAQLTILHSTTTPRAISISLTLIP
ncbi:hypothetical protein EV385_5159 [Krasilnikovia cinnamomea]|uniref:Lipoprotein n=1 Tax=Krasilnikovia cinnamomea TaxID=349313 RepID=A0A4Q7ZRN3_9ACTN|nr:hypothetical protein [Krasilnikovia cinnamomea]RZU53253.1 hypothetical protein EV385_5159 [Krasilnikovia cinnamomea]